MLRRNALLGACAIAALTASNTGWAQEGAATQLSAEVQDDGGSQPDGGIADIVVTAQKRAENVQDVPVAISAFTAGELQSRAIINVSQLSNLAPNVTLDAGSGFSGSSATLSAFIRGIGSDDFAFNIDPGVGVYVDGVYLARTVGANQDLPDVARIEVLKGPQGTLFGRNTIGGAISVVTRDPGKDLAIRGSVTAGSYQMFRVAATVDVPVSPDLATSLTFSGRTREGHLRRIPFVDQRVTNAPSAAAFAGFRFDPSSREGGEGNYTLRGKLKWDNGGAVRATLSADYGYENTSGNTNTLLGTTEKIPGPFAGTTNLPGTALDPTGRTGFLFAGLYNFCIGATPGQIAARNAQSLCGVLGTQFRPELRLPAFGSVNVDGNPANDRLPYDSRFITGDPDRSYATGNSFSTLRNWGVAATLEAEITDWLTAKSITGYRNSSWQSGLDADGSPLNIVQLSFDQRQKQFSEELQLIGNGLDDRLKYVLGAYYFSESGSLHDFVTFDEGLVQIDGPNNFKTSNYAFFGQIDFRPIDLIGLTVGARYTNEKKRFEGGQQDLDGINYRLFGCADANGNIFPGQPFPLNPAVTCQQALHYPDPTNPLRVYVPGTNRRTFTNFSPKLGVQLHPADDLMIYGSWSKGYKTGGWTTRLTNPLEFAPTFDEEKAETWEAGIKSRFFDRRVQLNLAAFTTAYRGIQLNFQEGTAPTLRNAGNARIKGVEAELIVLPFTGLTLNASLGHIDARYTSILPGVLIAGGPNPLQAGTLVGAPLPKTPRWKLNFNPKYEAELANGAKITFLADWTHSSSLWNDAQRTFALKRQASDIVNASIGYAPADDHWSLTVGATNLTNDRVIVSGNSSVAAGAIYGAYNRPREWYVRFGFDF